MFQGCRILASSGRFGCNIGAFIRRRFPFRGSFKRFYKGCYKGYCGSSAIGAFIVRLGFGGMLIRKPME